MKKSLSNYIGVTISFILMINVICCMGILIFQTPVRDDLFFFVWFNMIISIVLSALILTSLEKKKYYETNA
jgi:quinol-cytochrome oxidoreductase complex cytochrome b subunit